MIQLTLNIRIIPEQVLRAVWTKVGDKNALYIPEDKANDWCNAYGLITAECDRRYEIWAKTHK